MSVKDSVWNWITGGIAHFWGFFKEAAHGIILKILGTFGLTMISVKAVLPQLKAFVMQYTSGLPAEAMQFLGAIGLGTAMSMVFSALTIRMASKVFIVPTAVADQIKGLGP